MKKLITLLILLFLLFNNISTARAAEVLTFKEGIYQTSDFNLPQSKTYTIQNVSNTENLYMIIFDERQRELQSIRLSPKSLYFPLVPLQPDYRVVLIGKGEAIIV